MACGYICVFDVDLGDVDLWLLSPQSLFELETLLSTTQKVAQQAEMLYVSPCHHIRMINAYNIFNET